MKLKNKILTAGAALVLCASVYAATAPYVSSSAGGNTTAGASVIFPADPYNSQIRVVSVAYQSDSSTNYLSFTSGVNAFTCLATNTSTGVTQVLNSVSGLAANDVLVLQHAGVCYAATLSSTNNGTNAVLASGAWGVTPAIGDGVYKMSSATTIPVGATTNSLNGEAIYVATYPGRPVRVTLTPAAATNRLNNVVVRYQ